MVIDDTETYGIMYGVKRTTIYLPDEMKSAKKVLALLDIHFMGSPWYVVAAGLLWGVRPVTLR